MSNVEISCYNCKCTKALPAWKVTHATRTNRKLFCSRECHNIYKRNDWRKVSVRCVQCGESKKIKAGMHTYQKSIYPDKDKWFCDVKCYHEYKASNSLQVLVDYECDFCGNIFLIQKKHILRGSNHFCTRVCQGNHTTKVHSFPGRRSKLEVMIESYIRKDFPGIELQLNDRVICAPVELDIYIPELKIAIEINGPSHFHSIYGEEVLQKTVRNDNYKAKLCTQNNIQLIIVAETLKQYSDNSMDIYERLVKPHIEALYVDKIKHITLCL